MLVFIRRYLIIATNTARPVFGAVAACRLLNQHGGRGHRALAPSLEGCEKSDKSDRSPPLEDLFSLISLISRAMATHAFGSGEIGSDLRLSHADPHHLVFPMWHDADRR
jgi:hypothetical protein